MFPPLRLHRAVSWKSCTSSSGSLGFEKNAFTNSSPLIARMGIGQTSSGVRRVILALSCCAPLMIRMSSLRLTVGRALVLLRFSWIDLERSTRTWMPHLRATRCRKRKLGFSPTFQQTSQGLLCEVPAEIRTRPDWQLPYVAVLRTFSRSSASCRSSRGELGKAISSTSSMVFT